MALTNPVFFLNSYCLKQGRAEISRLIFAYADVKYDEQKISFPEWASLKPTFPFESLPVLDITENGQTVRIGQSVSLFYFDYVISAWICLDFFVFA